MALTAQDEIVKRIQELDREETACLNRIGDWEQSIAESERCIRNERLKAEVVATKRRQYEYALKSLNGELPDVEELPVETAPEPKRRNVIGVLG